MYAIETNKTMMSARTAFGISTPSVAQYSGEAGGTAYRRDGVELPRRRRFNIAPQATTASASVLGSGVVATRKPVACPSNVGSPKYQRPDCIMMKGRYHAPPPYSRFKPEMPSSCAASVH